MTSCVVLYAGFFKAWKKTFMQHVLRKRHRSGVDGLHFLIDNFVLNIFDNVITDYVIKGNTVYSDLLRATTDISLFRLSYVALAYF